MNNTIVKKGIDHCGGYLSIHSYDEIMIKLKMRLSYAFSDIYTSENLNEVITYVREKRGRFKGELIRHNSLETLTESRKCS